MATRWFSRRLRAALVQELHLVKAADWAPVRSSLIATAVALISGYAIWRYFNHGAEHRLSAAIRTGGPVEDDPDVAPASAHHGPVSSL